MTNRNNTIDRFVEKLMLSTNPEKAIWNVELLRAGKKPTWNYIDGCMMTSMISLYDFTKDQRYLDFVIEYTNYFVNEDGTINGYDKKHYSTDDVSQSRILFDLYKYTNNEKYLKAIHMSYEQVKEQPRTEAGNFWHKQIYPNQVWLDGIYMMQPFYTRYETEFNNKINYDDIVGQIKLVEKIMRDKDTGLYYHAYNEPKEMFWADKETGLSQHYWLRAIGWYLAGVADVYSYMEDVEKRAELAELLKSSVDSLLKYQDEESKMFYQIVDLKDREPNYLETSGSLLTSYAILKGSRVGALPANYAEIGSEIFEGVVNAKLTEVNGDLNLTSICLVAGLGPENNLRRDGTFEYYMSEPIVENDAKGVGPLIMAYSEMLQKK